MKTVAELRATRGITNEQNPDSFYTNEGRKETHFIPLRIPKVPSPQKLQQDLPFLARQKHKLVRQPSEHAVDVLHTENEVRVSGFLDRLRTVKSERVRRMQDKNEQAKQETRQSVLAARAAKETAKKEEALRQRIKRRKLRNKKS